MLQKIIIFMNGYVTRKFINMLEINGQTIYNERSARDYLASLGLDIFQIDAFVQYLTEDIEDEYANLEHDFMVVEQERDMIFENHNIMIGELLDLADELASGKGGTKVQYADRIKQICDTYYC